MKTKPSNSTQDTLSLTLIEYLKQAETPQLELEYWTTDFIPFMSDQQKQNLIQKLQATISKQASITSRSLSLLKSNHYV